MVPNTNNAQACEHVQNILDSLRTQLIQFTKFKQFSFS